jgi:hypothetical protein
MLDVWVVFASRVNELSQGVRSQRVANFWQLDYKLQPEMMVKDSGEGFWVCSGGQRNSIIFPHRFPHRGFCTASTSLSPFPLENTGLSIVPPIRNGNCNLPSTNAAPDIRAMVLVKKPSLVVISANPR